MMDSFETQFDVTPSELSFIVGACKQMNSLFGGGLEPEINWLAGELTYRELANFNASDSANINNSERIAIPTLSQTGLAIGPIVMIALELDQSITPSRYSDNYNNAADILEGNLPVPSAMLVKELAPVALKSTVNPYNENKDGIGDALDATPTLEPRTLPISLDAGTIDKGSVYLNAPTALSYANDYILN